MRFECRGLGHGVSGESNRSITSSMVSSKSGESKIESPSYREYLSLVVMLEGIMTGLRCSHRSFCSFMKTI